MTATATLDKKEAKDPMPGSTPQGKLPLKGASKGQQKSIDEKQQIIKAEAPAAVRKAAEALADAIDARRQAQTKENELAGQLVNAFTEAKKGNSIRIKSSLGCFYHFEKKNLTKLVKERQD